MTLVADLDPPPGWHWCPGAGAPAIESSASRRRWWRCSGCGWVGWSTPGSVETFAPPRHMRPDVQERDEARLADMLRPDGPLVVFPQAEASDGR